MLKPIGPYSLAQKAGDFIFLSGIISLDPASNLLIGTTTQEQTKKIIKHIKSILTKMNLTLESVVKMEVFMKNMDDFQSMNQVYEAFFSFPQKPTRQTFQVARLPMDALIEMSCIAYKGQP